MSASTDPDGVGVVASTSLIHAPRHRPHHSKRAVPDRADSVVKRRPEARPSAARPIAPPVSRRRFVIMIGHPSRKCMRSSSYASALNPASYYKLVQSLDPKRFFEKRRPRYWTQNIAMKYLAFSDSIRPAPTVNWRGRLSVLCSIVASNWAHFSRFSGFPNVISMG